MNIGLIILLSSIMLGQAVIFLPTFHEKLFILLSKPTERDSYSKMANPLQGTMMVNYI